MNSQDCNQTIPSTAQYSVSVPIYVYRQVVQELETTQQQLQKIEAKNRQLRTQVTQLTLSAIQIQNVVDFVEREAQLRQPRREDEFYQLTPQLRNQSQLRKRDRSKKAQNLANRQIITVESSQKSYLSTQVSRKWFLSIVIVLIIFTVISGGLILIRPLLNNHNYR